MDGWVDGKEVLENGASQEIRAWTLETDRPKF